MGVMQLLVTALGLNILYLWLEVWDIRRKAKKRLEAVEARLTALEQKGGSVENYMNGVETWLS